MSRPHQTHAGSSWPHRASERNGLVTTSLTPVAISASLDSRLSSIVPPQDSEVLKHALGTLEYRKQRNRKRTRTGEYVWTDEADLVFALALIAWTSNRVNRIGARRANFLQQFLASNGFSKTRKQIASRLQVLKGEWSATSYLSLLDDPDQPKAPNRRQTASPSLSIGSEQPSHASYPCPRTPPTQSPTSSTSLLPRDVLNSSVGNRRPIERSTFYPPAAVLAPRHPSRSFTDPGYSPPTHDPRRQLPNPFARPESSFPLAGHQLHLHAPAPLTPHSFQPTFSSPSVSAPGPSIPHQSVFANSYPSCAECGSHAIGGALGGSLRKTHQFMY